MSKRPTIRDLAREARVSVATVDRVLNARLPVREDTARRVYEAALALDYHAVSILRHRMRQELPGCRLGILFQAPGAAFCQMVEQHIQQAAKAHPAARVEVRFEHAPLASEALVVEKMYALAERSQAIAVVAPDYPLLAPAIEELKARGIAVFALISDVANGIRAGYVGLNNRKVGRTAAWCIAKTTPAQCGKVACFVGSHRYHAHESREIGLRSYFREYAPQFEVIETSVNLESADVTFEATLHLLRQHPDLAGIYVAGDGAEGALAALQEAGKDRQLPVVASELTPARRMALAEGRLWHVIAAPLPAIAGACINAMVDAVLAPDASLPGDMLFPFELYCPESL